MLIAAPRGLDASSRTAEAAVRAGDWSQARVEPEGQSKSGQNVAEAAVRTVANPGKLVVEDKHVAKDAGRVGGKERQSQSKWPIFNSGARDLLCGLRHTRASPGANLSGAWRQHPKVQRPIAHPRHTHLLSSSSRHHAVSCCSSRFPSWRGRHAAVRTMRNAASANSLPAGTDSEDS